MDREKFIIDQMPIGVILLNKNRRIVFRNRQARVILKRIELPEDVFSLAGRIFEATRRGDLKGILPGEVYIFKKYYDSPSRWIFRVFAQKQRPVYVCVFIIEEKVSNKFDVNEFRRQYRLTRRESDVLRCVVDGFKNSEIAMELRISPYTVKDYISNILEKTGVRNRNDLLRMIVAMPANQTETPPPSGD